MRTMKIMKRMMGLAAAILALSACSESEDLLSAFHSDPNAVRITAEVGKASANGFTRSYPLGDAEAQKKFKEGDMISVQADGQDAVTYQLNNNEWQPQGEKFLKWESDEMNFTAYYPASFDGNIDNITLPKEYDEASLAANDFMSYSGKQSNTKGNQLTLTMERKMARVVVEIAGFNDQYTTNATVNSLSICGIKAYKHSDGNFYALIKPCEAQNSETFLSLEVAEGESKTTTETLTGIPALAAGNSYTYKLKVGKNKISVSGITVKEWTTGEITGGKAEEAILPPYVTFKAEREQIFKMTTTSPENELYVISGLEYSVNNNDVWKKVVENEPVTFGGTKGTLRLRGTNPNGTAESLSKYSKITFTDENVNVACTGDIRTLLNYKNYKTVDTSNARFCYLFDGCAVLTSAPDLPVETLADKCYFGMFDGCTSLKTAPNLLATKLAEKCYYRMFAYCESLETAPNLPAESLASYCYGYMFQNCTNLKSTPELRATTLASGCYEGMFQRCTSLVNTSTLLATTLTHSCYKLMFDGCTNLETAPALPATTLAIYCYGNMFRGCKNLTSVTMLAPSEQISEKTYCCNYWLKDAGTSAASRKLIVQDEAAYNALVNAGLPAKWKTGTEGATVEYAPKQ
jgi:hypothetical protein